MILFPSTTRVVVELLFLLTLPSLIFSQQHEHCDVSNNNDETCTPLLEKSNAGTPPQPQLPDDFIDPCQDSTPDCATWAKEGECKNNPNFMINFCARSCGSCQSLSLDRGGEAEFDQKEKEDAIILCPDDYKECNDWAMEGECSINPVFMHARCKYSCWKCVDVHRDQNLGVSEDIIAKKLLYSNMDTGKHQLLRKFPDDNDQSPMTKEDNKNVLTTIRQMDYYAKHTMTDPSIDMKMRERCRNEFRMCAEWASRGMCLRSDQPQKIFNTNGAGQNGIFMMNMCPLACRMCSELESFHKCAGRRLPQAQPLFQPGELYSFFERMRLSSDAWAEYEPVFVSYPNVEKEGEGQSSDPYLIILKKFLSDEEADHLQSLGSTIGWTPSTSGAPSLVRCHDEHQCNNDDIYQRTMRRIASLTNSTTMSYLEPMEMNHFHSSSQHESTLQHNFEELYWKPAGPRVLSLSLFLSNAVAEGGGGLGFPHLDWVRIQPKKGMAVLWANVKNDNLLESDPLMSFEHFPLQKGDEMFVSNVHVRLHNWTDADIRGCA